jgi:hypothetical protein
MLRDNPVPPEIGDPWPDLDDRPDPDDGLQNEPGFSDVFAQVGNSRIYRSGTQPARRCAAFHAEIVAQRVRAAQVAEIRPLELPPEVRALCSPGAEGYRMGSARIIVSKDDGLCTSRSHAKTACPPGRSYTGRATRHPELHDGDDPAAARGVREPARVLLHLYEISSEGLPAARATGQTTRRPRPLAELPRGTLVLHGGARGADRIAGTVAACSGSR